MDFQIGSCIVESEEGFSNHMSGAVVSGMGNPGTGAGYYHRFFSASLPFSRSGNRGEEQK